MDSYSATEGAAEIEKFETLFRQIPAALALLRGPDFVFEKANAEYLNLIDRTDIIGKPLLEVLPEIEDQPFPKLLEKVFLTGETFQAKEIEAFLRIDSLNPEKLSKVYLDLTYRRVLDPQGKPYGIFAFVINVTQKVLSRLEVQLEKQKLEAVFANASASLALLRGSDGIYEKVNQSYQNLFSDRVLLEKPVLQALPELIGQKFPQLISHVFATGETYVETEALAYLRKPQSLSVDGRYFDQSYTRITDGDGTPYGVLIHAIDVTERVHSRRELRESEERFRSAIESAKLGTWEVNMVTQVVNMVAENFRVIWSAFH